ncbi:polyprenol phosphomannose-dependent alpha 1,6 mannosyltransferase MptB [Paenarthrobacter sp. Z7-10]|uniref:polyprenol phosphomannose-dependent alpha 1,6 mannosyltransferase MptB n=1 Tax=Paenarthrobacter sp. Z7-10 TaxID=2787635 RepID=UPI0022A98114|nr:polyprenol phosphomannose-dependent alpha 1,6 mannosyltransferase MptB [Paenarthrobacter sp. Z7-10]MCZ2403799.1 polyprenol phosphomannose-dependent alpha 1,6 mannosyltransferase MptB [Paenarthrobacter sp. Z7-10]
MLTSKPRRGGAAKPARLGDGRRDDGGGATAVLWGTDAEPAAGPAAADAAKTLNIALLQGFVASLLMLAGSVGVGWLAGSSALIRNPLFILARTSPAGVITATVMLCFGALLLVRSWLRLAQRIGQWDSSAHPILIKALLLWGLPLALALPLFSRDVYAYIGQGRLMVQGLNPYTNGISALNNYYSLGPDTLWTEAPTPYGPLFLWIEQFAVWVGFGVPELSIIPFRLVALAGVALCAIFIPKLAAVHGINPQRALWLMVLNPVLLLNFIASAHNDSLMLGLVVAGVYCASTRKPWLAIVLVTASIAVKPITLIALPFVGLLWAGSKAGWGRKVWCWLLTALVSFGLLWICGLANGLGFGWIGALNTPGKLWIWYAPVGTTGAVLGWLADQIGVSGDIVTNVVHLIGKALSVAVVVWLAVRRVDGPAYGAVVVRRMAWAFAAVVLLAPMIQPWYMLWLLAFFAVTGIEATWQLRTVLCLTTFFTLIALTDQLSVFQWIPIAIVRGVAIAVGVSFALHMIFIDRKTKGVFGRPTALLWPPAAKDAAAEGSGAPGSAQGAAAQRSGTQSSAAQRSVAQRFRWLRR